MAKLILQNQTEPASPDAGCTTLYVDSGDGKAKLKDSDGCVNTIICNNDLVYPLGDGHNGECHITLSMASQEDPTHTVFMPTGEYNFTNFIVDSGVCLRFCGATKPVTIRATGKICIMGNVDMYSPSINSCKIYNIEDFVGPVKTGFGSGVISVACTCNGGCGGVGAIGSCPVYGGRGGDAGEAGQKGSPFCGIDYGGAGGAGATCAGGGGGGSTATNSSCAAGGAGCNATAYCGGDGGRGGNGSWSYGGGGGYGYCKGGNGGSGCSLGGNGGDSMFCGGNGGGSCCGITGGCGGFGFYICGGNGGCRGGNSVFGTGGCGYYGGTSLYGKGGCGQATTSYSSSYGWSCSGYGGSGRDGGDGVYGGNAMGGNYSLILSGCCIYISGCVYSCGGKGGNGGMEKSSSTCTFRHGGNGSNGGDVYLLYKGITGNTKINVNGGSGGTGGGGGCGGNGVNGCGGCILSCVIK